MATDPQDKIDIQANKARLDSIDANDKNSTQLSVVTNPDHYLAVKNGKIDRVLPPTGSTLSSSVSSTSTTVGANSLAVKTANDNAQSKVSSVSAGTNVAVDNTDPQNPIISSTGGGGGATNLSTTNTATQLEVVSDTGTNAVIPKADIEALGLNASTVNGKTIAENVPAGAVFTDTQNALSSAIDQSSIIIGANQLAVKTINDKIKSKVSRVFTGDLVFDNDMWNIDTVTIRTGQQTIDETGLLLSGGVFFKFSGSVNPTFTGGTKIIKSYHDITTAGTYDCFIWYNGDEYLLSIPEASSAGGSSDTTAPTAPTNLAALNQTESTIDLSWTASTDNVAVTGYDVYQGSSVIATVITTSYQVTGLSASTNYSYFIKAKDAGNNESLASNVVNTSTTSASLPTLSGFFVFDASPSEITFNSSEIITASTFAGFSVGSGKVFNGITINAGQLTGHKLILTAPYSNVEGNDTISYTTGSDLQDTSGNNLASFTNLLLTNGVGLSQPAAPTTVTVGNITDTTIQLNWTKSTSGVQTEYRVYLGGTIQQIFVGDVATGTITGLTPNTAYNNLTVRAFNGAFESTDSNSVSATTAVAGGSGLQLGTANVNIFESTFSDTETVVYEWKVTSIGTNTGKGQFFATNNSLGSTVGAIRDNSTVTNVRMYIIGDSASSTPNTVVANGDKIRLVRRITGSTLYLDNTTQDGTNFVEVSVTSGLNDPAGFTVLSEPLVHGGHHIDNNGISYRKDFVISEYTIMVGSGGLETIDFGQAGTYDAPTNVLSMVTSSGRVVRLGSGKGASGTDVRNAKVSI